MIGTLRVPMPHGGEVLADLQDDGAWTCPDDVTQLLLNHFFRKTANPSGVGPFGNSKLRAAAKYMEAVVVCLNPGTNTDPERVY